MYEITNKKGESVAFKDDKIKTVLLSKNGLFYWELVVHAGDTILTFTRLSRANAKMHYNVLHDMIIDQEQ